MQSKLFRFAITTVALSIAAIAPASAAKFNSDQFIGFWSGSGKRWGGTIEFRVHHIDEGNNVYGNYCWSRNNWNDFFDAHPEDGISVKLKGKKIRWNHNKRRWAFSLRGRDGTKMRMEFWNEKGNKSTVNLTREAEEDSLCLSRVSKLPFPGGK